MEKPHIDQLGDELYDALVAQRTLPPLTDRFSDISIEDAYFISQRMLSRRLEAGERVVGKKIGVTSKPEPRILAAVPDRSPWPLWVRAPADGLAVGSAVGGEPGLSRGSCRCRCPLR